MWSWISWIGGWFSGTPAEDRPRLENPELARAALEHPYPLTASRLSVPDRRLLLAELNRGPDEWVEPDQCRDCSNMTGGMAWTRPCQKCGGHIIIKAAVFGWSDLCGKNVRRDNWVSLRKILSKLEADGDKIT